MPRVKILFLITALSALSIVPAGFAPRASAQDATPDAACPATTEEENEAIVRRWTDDVINRGDLSALDEIAAPDIVHHAGTFPDGVGVDAVKHVFEALQAGFTDVTQTIEQVISDGDMVVTRWSSEGTHSGEFQGHPATGKQITWTGINIFRIECGLIAEEWSEVDGLGRLTQMESNATPVP